MILPSRAAARPASPGALALIASLALVHGTIGGEEAAAVGGAPGPDRVIVAVLTGALAPEEVSPTERSPAKVLWSLALEGVALARIDLGGSPLVTAPLESLRARLLGPDAAPGDVILFETPPREAPAPDGAAPGADSPGGDGLPQSIQNLHGLFRPPPPETEEERALRAAVLAAVKDEGPPPQPAPAPARPARAASESEAVAGAASARLTIFRVNAPPSESGIQERNELLGKLIRAAGDTAHVVVACAPEGKEGAVFARGPRLRSGWVIDANRPAAMTEGIIRRLLGAEDARNEASEIFE